MVYVPADVLQLRKLLKRRVACRLPNLRIIPASYSESKGTTLILSRYVALEPSWTLGYGVQLAWPRCVQHVRTPDGMTSAIARAPGAIG